MNYIVGIALAVSIGGALYFALRSPAVWTALSQALANAATKAVLKDLAPRDQTPRELNDVVTGQEHSDRPSHHPKGE